MIILLFKSLKIHLAVQKLGGSFGSSFAIRKQLLGFTIFQAYNVTLIMVMALGVGILRPEQAISNN